MSGDYIHNPPNLGVPCRDNFYYYIILFVNSKSLQIKGQATIYRRKTLQMMLDLINDFNQIYMHEGIDNQITKITQQNDPEMYFRVIYTNNFKEVMNKINKEAYIIKFAWKQIPNYNPINSFYPPPNNQLLPHPYRPFPPYPSEYSDDENEAVQRFSQRQK